MLKFGHFGLNIGSLCFWNLNQNPWDYKTRAQELTSGAIRMSLSFSVKIWELFKDGRVWGLFYQMNLVVIYDIFHNFWYISTLDEPIWWLIMNIMTNVLVIMIFNDAYWYFLCCLILLFPRAFLSFLCFAYFSMILLTIFLP